MLECNDCKLRLKWIKTSECLPKHEQNNLIIYAVNQIWHDVMYCDYPEDKEPSFYYEYTDSIIMLSEVSHWMPGIEPPKEEQP